MVKFQLVNESGEPLSGLTAGEIYFAIAKLVPPGTQLAAVPPQTAAPAPLVSSQWQNYIYTTATPAPTSAGTPTDPVVGTKPQPQGTIEAGTAGTFVDNGDGTYQYTFAKNLSADPAVPYVPTLTHRVGFEIRGVTNAAGTTIAANSPVYTFQPSSGATTGITQYDIVEDQTCKNCHQVLAWHGGARTEVKYCVMCHNPSSLDPSSGNTLDFKVMFHKIHMGEDLPSVTGTGTTQSNYYIFGYGNAISDYSTVAYPQADASNNNTAVSGTGQRFCATCHNTSDALTPQAGNFSTAPSAAACGSCHDNVNFTTGQGHSAANIVANDTQCSTCHGPTSTIDNGALQVVAAHHTPVDAAIAKFQFTVVSITNTAPGQIPVATIKVTDPTNNNAPYDITSTTGPFQAASSALNLDIAWNTIDFNNVGSGSATGPSVGHTQSARGHQLQGGRPELDQERGRLVHHARDHPHPRDHDRLRSRLAGGPGGRHAAQHFGMTNTVATGTTATELGVQGAESHLCDHRPDAGAAHRDRRHRQVRYLPQGADLARPEPHRRHQSVRLLSQPERHGCRPAHGRFRRLCSRHSGQSHRLQGPDPQDPCLRRPVRLWHDRRDHLRVRRQRDHVQGAVPQLGERKPRQLPGLPQQRDLLSGHDGDAGHDDPCQQPPDLDR